MSIAVLRQSALLVLCALVLQAGAQHKASAASGKAVYDKTCALCHAGGIAAAPRFGNSGDWAARVKTGVAALYKSALQGTSKGMPAKGGNLSLSDAEVKSAVDYMLGAVGGAADAGKTRPAAAAKPASGVPKASAAPAAKQAVASSPAPDPAPEPKAAPARTVADPNAFNRLLAPPSAWNLPPWRDGIHDPDSPGTTALQAPRESFRLLPRNNSGNRVDWVGALATQRIRPRWDLRDTNAAAPVMDLNIVREVKGSMPDVVYPHKQHTEWLDCSNCHPAIFIPQKGANQISMASILLGRQCGVCHGKVAFPVSECRLCHSKKKDDSARAVGAVPAKARK